MRDLSLHILDLLDNAVRAGATTLRVSVTEDRARDRLEVVVEDDGPGLDVAPERATDPFYTTGNKRVGLGLSLFRQTALDANGKFEIERSELGGTAVRALLQLSHVDRKPMGDLAGSLFAIACTHPETEIRCDLRVADTVHSFTRPRASRHSLGDSRRFAKQVRGAVKNLDV